MYLHVNKERILAGWLASDEIPHLAEMENPDICT